MREDGKTFIQIDPKSLKGENVVPLNGNGPNKLGVDGEAVLVDGLVKADDISGGKLLIEVKNYTSKMTMKRFKKQIEKHFDSNVIPLIKDGAWIDGVKPHLHFTWMGDLFQDASKVAEMKKAVLDICKGRMGEMAEKLKFSCKDDITFRILPELIVPLTTKG